MERKIAAGVIIHLRHGHLAPEDRLLEFFAVEVIHRLLMVEPRGRCLDRAVGSAPVGNHEAFEQPILLEHIGQGVIVLAGVDAVDGVVGAHDRSGIADLNADMEGEQIGLLHGPLANDHVDIFAAIFLIVHDVVLDVADDVLGLLALDAIAHQGAGEQRIFALVFEGSSVARLAG